MIQTVAFAAARNPEAQEARKRLAHRYGDAPEAGADVIVVLGGDGYMLRSLHDHMDLNVPLYGMNRGSVGFLMNAYAEDDLIERLNQAEITELHPLQMTVTDIGGETHSAFAFNEVSIVRTARTAAKLRVAVDGTVRLEEMICDGVLVSTPAGSTAYNLSAHGPILPTGSGLLALTPISVFRPRRWRGALLPDTCSVSVDVIDPVDRPVIAAADFFDIADATHVEVMMAENRRVRLMFDLGHDLEERIVREQFVP
jgi:NAD+ kinase